MMSARRTLNTLVLAGWCALFWFLILSGRTSLYLSSRTDWIVPVGAWILTVATFGRALGLRARHPDPIRREDLVGASILLLPVILIAFLPAASLGAFAASRRTTLASAGVSASASEIAEGPLSLVDVAGALRSPEAMKVLASRAGETVTFVGFVTRERSDPADSFTLNRFMISCCVADALAVRVRVVGATPGAVDEEGWVRVRGRIFPLAADVAVEALEVEPIERPRHPYLDP